MTDILIRDALKSAQSLLLSEKIPEIEARYILEWVLNKSFTEVINSYEEMIHTETYDKYMQLINKRRTHYPLQYILNHQNFYGFDFFVDERVLIPRPETELLVEKIITDVNELIKQGKRKLSILDLCTGSGCIIISIAKYIEEHLDLNVQIDLVYVATDISKDALSVAQFNEKKLMNQQSIQWRQGDLFSAISSDVDHCWRKEFDIIVSNPPYISPEEILTLSPEVKCFEPINALDGGECGLEFYEKISSLASDWLNNEGKLFFEIGHGQMTRVKNILQKNMFIKVEGMHDFYGCERIVQGVFLRES